MITKPTIYEMTVYDRSLVGKHDIVASGPLHIDPKTAAGTRSVLLPLQPQGMLRLSIATDGGEKREVRPYIDAATALLERTEAKMAFGCLERMMEFIKDQLSHRALTELTRPNKGKPAKKLGMGMSMGGAKEQKVAPEQSEIETSLGELFAHLNANVGLSSLTRYPVHLTRVELIGDSSRRFRHTCPRLPGTTSCSPYGTACSNTSSRYWCLPCLTFPLAHPYYAHKNPTSSSNGCK